MPLPRLLRFCDLKESGVVQNRVTLEEWIRHENFPPGMKLAARTRAWTEEVIEQWIASRPVATALTATDDQSAGNAIAEEKRPALRRSATEAATRPKPKPPRRTTKRHKTELKTTT